MKNLAFAIENNVGNATYRQNLQRLLDERTDVSADFLPVELVADDLWAKIPIVRGNLALVASARATSALRASNRRKKLHAALIHSQSIGLFSTRFMGTVPTIISTDATPANFDTLNEGYGAVTRNRAVESLKSVWTRSTFRASSLLLAWSDWVRDSFVNDYNVDPEKVITLHPGLDVDLWKPDPCQNANDGIVRVLFVSGDFKRKGGDLLIRWIQRTRHRAKVQIHMASKTPVPDVPGVVGHYGLTANSPGLVQLTQSCDLFALPTRADCSPWVIVEAQAAGLPGVSTRVGAIHELVVDGETGLLAPAGDEDGFFDRMDQLVEDDGMRKRMSEAARERAVTRFDLR
ncbi:MAG: glycosyltransferase family 4 protein, partial [Gemmatimonadaceae bacterium]